MKESALFYFQIIMALVLTVPQALYLIQGKTEGLTLAMWVIFMAYIILSLFLAIASYRTNPSLIRKRTIIVFAMWFILIGILVVLGINRVIWRPCDTMISIVIGFLSVVTVIRYRGMSDPMAKGFIAVWCKAAPQLWLAWTMWSVGGASGMPLLSLLAGHGTAIPRLTQIYLAGKQEGWDRPTKGLLLGEIANVVTWGVVTVVWLVLLR